MEYIEDNNIEKNLEGQIKEFDYTEKKEPIDTNNQEQQDPNQEQPAPKQYESMIGKKINVGPNRQVIDREGEREFANEHRLSRKGESIVVNADIREGWMDVDKALLGDRAQFYKTDWEFRIRPATVEAIRHWSTIDDENSNSIDRVFNEVMKTCFAIVTANGPIPWYNIYAWDRFFFILLIREYSMGKGETNIEYTEDCINCNNPVTFKLTSSNLLYEMPDEEVMPMFDQVSGNWIIDTNEYGLESDEPLRLWLPTLEKDINIKQWIVNRYQENPNRELDPVLIKFLPWFLPKISKDDTIAQRQINEFRRKFESWDTDTFSFYNDVINNVMVTPNTRLIQKCPVCGEEVTSPIRFPNGASALFHVESKFKKFGKK